MNTDFAEPDIRIRLEQARLPAMPQILGRLMQLCQSDDTSIAELADLIAKEPAMAAKVLGVANSSAYHRNQQIGLEQALMTIGTDMVKLVLINESVFQVFNTVGRAGKVDLRGFWKHSLGAAMAARTIAKKMAYPYLEEAYLAGLLHDVGRIALFAAAPEWYAHHFTAQDDADLCAVEQRTLQISHAEAGAWLIEKWQLDSFLADSVLYHHEPEMRLAEAHPLIRIVYLANVVSGPGDAGSLEAAGALCGIHAIDELIALRERVFAEIEKTAAQLGIDLSEADAVPPPAVAAAPAMQDTAQEQLADTMRDMMLSTEVGRALARQSGEAKLFESILRSARLLFGLDDAVVLLMNETGDTLRGNPAGGRHQRLAGFTVALGGGGTLAAAVARRRPAFAERSRNPLDMHEEQLLRIMHAEGLVCIPLMAADRCIGVIAGALSASTLRELQSRENFLKAFGAQAGAAIDAAQKEHRESSRAAVEAEEKYREASRRAAHEISNPLSIIRNYLGVLDRKLAKQQPISTEISILNEEIDRVGQIINSLGDTRLTPASPASPEAAEANQVITDVIRLFRNTEFAPASIELEARLVDQPCQLDSDVDTLKQILVNLVKNAIEAMPDGGAIEIRNHGLVNRDGRLYIELVVADTGPGMAPEIMANLFSPVRSTKGGAHRGLGLSIVHGLVKRKQGLISCRSNTHGTTFELLLPARTNGDHATETRPRLWTQA